MNKLMCVLTFITTSLFVWTSAFAIDCGPGPVYNCCVNDSNAYCAKDGSDALVTKCGDILRYCRNNGQGYCLAGPGKDGAGASCQVGDECISNGARVCKNTSEVVDNCNRFVRSCSTTETCVDGDCKPKDACDASRRSCNADGNAQNECGQVNTCKYGCDSGACKSRPMCSEQDAAIRKCVGGNIVNGCYDIVQECKQGECQVNLSTHECRCPGTMHGKCNVAIPGTCLQGTVSADNFISAPGGTRTWQCLGSNGGVTDYCSTTIPKVPVDGVCGAEAGTCSDGIVEDYVNNTTCGQKRTRKCVGSNGGSTKPCEKNNGACGATGTCATIMDGFCGIGTKVLDNAKTGCGETRSWYCEGPNGGAKSPLCSQQNLSCSTPGQCGTAAQSYTADAGGFAGVLCASGEASPMPAFPSPGGSITWSCPGQFGGAPTTCTARRGNYVAGICGSAARTFGENEAAGGSWCETGSAVGSLAIPAPGGTTNWACLSPNGGGNASCEAKRQLNGQCGGALGACAKGSLVWIDKNLVPQEYAKWSCVGANGGITDYCRLKNNGPCPVGSGKILCPTTSECVDEASKCPPTSSTGASASCKWIDPPTVNTGEYVPIFWKMNAAGMLATDSRLHGLTDQTECNSSNPWQIRKDTVMCTIELKRGDGLVTSDIEVPCYKIDAALNSTLFGQQFIDSLGVSSSLFS